MNDFTIEKITKSLTMLREEDPVSYDHRTRAAVLIPLFCESGDWKILFTRRSQTVQDHRGQVSFPGGAFEYRDDDIEKTALRETFEEIGIQSDQIRILGRMSSFTTISNYLITPVVGLLEFPFAIKPAIEEVERVFSVPLSWLADPKNSQERDYARPNGEIEKVLFFQETEGEVIWGITARILKSFLQIITNK